MFKTRRNRLQHDNPQDCFRAVLDPSRDRFRGWFHDPMAAILSGRGALIRRVSQWIGNGPAIPVLGG